MARITIEDCIKKIPNRFELVLLAAERARRIAAGDEATIAAAASVSVIALKELAAGNLDIDKLRESFISSQQQTDIDIESIDTQDIDVTSAADNLIQNEEAYDANYDFSPDDLDDNFSDILLGKG